MMERCLHTRRLHDRPADRVYKSDQVQDLCEFPIFTSILASVQKSIWRINLWEEDVGRTVEGLPSVMRQIKLAERHEQVTVASEPMHIAAIKAYIKLLSGLGAHVPMAVNSRIDLP